MAVYWADVYVDSPIGGIHGTTNTTTRTGSYAAPFSFADIQGSSTSDVNSAMYNMSDGDEIRLKGLPMSSYLIDIGTFYNNNGNTYHRKSGESDPSAWTNSRAARKTYNSHTAADCWAVLHDKSITDTITMADSAGNKPYIFQQMTDDNQDGRMTQPSYNRSFSHNCLSFSPHNDQNNTTMNLKVVDWRYYQTDGTKWNASNSGGNGYFACYSNKGIKVTDGWTSETVRDGYTFIIQCFDNNMSTWRYWYFNATTNSTTGPDTLYDMPNTYLLAIYSRGNSYPYQYWYFSPATGGYHSGKNYTQKFGGAAKNDPGWPIYHYIGNYYYTGDGQYHANAQNNSEFGYMMGYYGAYTNNNNYGDGTIVHRINNTFSDQGHQMYMYSNLNKNKVLFGSSISYNRACFYAGGGSNGASFDMMNNSYYSVYNGDRDLIGGNFSPSVSYPTTLYGPENTTNKFNPQCGPTSGGTVRSYTALNPKDTFKLTSTKWWEINNLFYYARQTTPHEVTQANFTIGELECGGNDYRSTNPSFKVKSYMYLYYNDTSNQGDVNWHFANNDYDNIPVGALPSTNFNNSMHTPMLYYNESNGSICFITPDYTTSPGWFVKKFTIPCNTYTSSNTLTLTANIKHTSGYSGNYMLGCYFIRGSDGNYISQYHTSSTVYTSNTDFTPSTSLWPLGTSSAKYITVFFGIQPGTNRGPSNNNDKMWLNSLSATIS